MASTRVCTSPPPGPSLLLLLVTTLLLLSLAASPGKFSCHLSFQRTGARHEERGRGKDDDEVFVVDAGVNLERERERAIIISSISSNLGSIIDALVSSCQRLESSAAPACYCNHFDDDNDGHIVPTTRRS